MKNKSKIVVCILFITLIFFSMTGNIFAQVNQNYGNLSPVEEDNIEGKVTNSVLANAIGALVYALASLAENLVGGVFENITGDATFPWADRVIFNAVPFLDINFFNPASGSLFLSGSRNTTSDAVNSGAELGSGLINGTTQTGTKTGSATMLANIVRNIYFTMLTLAIGLLSVVVGIMAIKLAISTIASEKAKYKEAITNWLFAIIMIFTVHFAMSFVFFVNEKMVEIASSLISDELNRKTTSSSDDSQKVYISQHILNQSSVKRMLMGFNNLGAYSKGIDIDFEQSYNDVLAYWYDNFDGSDKHVRDFLLTGENGNLKVGSYLNASSNIKSSYTDKYEEFKDYFLAFEAFIKENFYTKQGNYYIAKNKSELKNISQKIKTDTGAINKFNRVYGGNLADQEFIKNTIIPYLERLLKERGLEHNDSGWYYININNDGGSSKDIIATLGTWFKEQAWAKGWVFKYVTFQGAILYAIFVTQSILYFFAYVKRFFYVVILAVLAPLVIIYDFLGKNM